MEVGAWDGRRYRSYGYSDPGIILAPESEDYERALLRHFAEQGVAPANGKHDVRFTTDGER